MGKILHFNESSAPNVIDWLKEAVDIANESDVESVIVVFKCKNREVMTGYLNADAGTRMEMVGHIQADIVDYLILANIDRYWGE